VVDGYSGRVLYAQGARQHLLPRPDAGRRHRPGRLRHGRWLALAVSIIGSSSKNDSGDLVLLALPFVIGGALIFGGYRLFRWGEEIEERAKVSA